MPKLTKRAIRYRRTNRRMEGLTGPYYRKASFKKITLKRFVGIFLSCFISFFICWLFLLITYPLFLGEQFWLWVLVLRSLASVLISLSGPRKDAASLQQQPPVSQPPKGINRGRKRWIFCMAQNVWVKNNWSSWFTSLIFLVFISPYEEKQNILTFTFLIIF